MFWGRIKLKYIIKITNNLIISVQNWPSIVLKLFKASSLWFIGLYSGTPHFSWNRILMPPFTVFISDQPITRIQNQLTNQPKQDSRRRFGTLNSLEGFVYKKKKKLFRR